MYEAIDVAAYLIQKAHDDNVQDMTPLKLQKLLYFAQGWYLAIHKVPLFKDRIFAWEYGPVIDSVYQRYKNGPVANITPDMSLGNAKNITDSRAKKVLNEMWKRYGKETAFALVGMTHVSKPWKDAYHDPLDDEINVKEIQDYFTALQ
jgi:uncharacterized phage-associated protein